MYRISCPSMLIRTSFWSESRSFAWSSSAASLESMIMKGLISRLDSMNRISSGTSGHVTKVQEDLLMLALSRKRSLNLSAYQMLYFS